jgi:hypothetical protein
MYVQLNAVTTEQRNVLEREKKIKKDMTKANTVIALLGFHRRDLLFCLVESEEQTFMLSCSVMLELNK